jgi:type IV pilus assembly protein PilE
LIELMIVVAIISILAAVAYPSYSRYMVRSHRSAAQAYLMDVAARQQQYFLDNRGYATQAQMTGTGGLDALATGSQILTDYDITITPTTPTTTFTVTATPKAGGVPQKFGDPAISIDNTGLKSPATLWQ